MPHASPTDLLVLHAVRLKGFADTDAVAARFGLDPGRTLEDLLDAEACGWASRAAFADLAGWSLTEAGRRRNEAQLAEELDRTGARAAVDAVHRRFPPLNTEATTIFTRWQLGSDDADRGTDALDRLAGIADTLRDLERELTAHLTRFEGYHDRFARALVSARRAGVWVTGAGVDSCHQVWFEVHEDLLATLGISR